MKAMTDIASLKAERQALDDRIALLEAGVKKAAYDAEMKRQLLTINEHRLANGKRQISKAEFASGILVEASHDG